MPRQATILLLLCCTFVLQSGAQVYPFVSYTPRDGLVGNKVRFISQDSKGRLYFGTTSGLSIYDGSRFTNYSTENGLYSNLVNGILEEGDDSVFVVLNADKLQYIHNGKVGTVFLKDSFCPVINQFIRCNDGHEYAIADEGLFRFDKDHFSRIFLDRLTSIGADKNLAHVTELDSSLVINMDVFNPAYAAPKSFIIYNYYTGKVITDPHLPDIYYSAKTAKGELLLATAKGVFMLDKKALKKDVIKLLAPSKLYNLPPSTMTNRFYMDAQQNLWVNTQKGILKASTSGSNKIFSEQNGSPLNDVSCIFQDREGTMWFGNDLKGVAKLVDQDLQYYKEFIPGFITYDVSIPKNSDSVWMYDHTHHRLLLDHHQVVHEFSMKGAAFFFRIAMGSTKFYSFGPSSLYELHLSKNNCSTSELYTSQVSPEFSCLVIDRKENPIAIGKSIVAILPNRKIVRDSLDYFVDNAVLTKDDLLFVVTRSMNIYIYKANPSDPDSYLRLLYHYNWRDRNIEPRSIDVDSSGRLWIGTRQRGLFEYTVTNGEIKLIRQLTTKDGLTENFVKYVYCDAKGHIWASSQSGLDKISFTNGNVHIENVTKASNIYLDMWKTESDKEGVVWGVASTGLIKVYPSNESSPGVTPKIVLTKFTINNQDVSFQQKGINLKYFQNNLSFQVAVPSFFDEKKTLFSYKLDAGKKTGTWTELSSRADISFLNLSPGNYDLRVRSVFLNGRYAPLETAYSFTIMSPWWQTWWFRCIEFFSALFAIVMFIRFYYHNQLQQQRIALEKKQAIEKERTRIATDMHDDMGAGLSRIKVLSETIKFENGKGIVNPAHLQKISDYSEEMMDKMGDIVWALNQRNDSMDDLLGYTRAYAMDYLTSHNIHCVFHAPSEHPEIFARGEMRRNIFLSIKEALHNVVKHAGATRVEISITLDNQLCVLIHDNGRGIDMEKTRTFGNGLHNIMKRMAEVGGVAGFKNENGTRVMLRMPLN